MGDRGVLTIRDGVLSLSPQDGIDHGPCTPGWPRQMRADYAEKWGAEHKIQPGTQSPLENLEFHTPPGYDDDREHLWNYFQSVRTRRPSVEDASFGNNTALGCHMANYSYFRKTIATWDAGAKEIKG
jgi:hypothetical protein